METPQQPRRKRTGSEQSAAPPPLPMGLRAPHSVDAERSVLGSMLLDPAIIPEVMHEVSADDFYVPAHRAVYEVVTELHDRPATIDLTLVIEELRRRGRLEECGGVVGVASLESSTIYSGTAPELAKLVAGKALLRRLMGAADSILRDCAEEKNDVETQLQVAEHLIFQIGNRVNAASFVPIGDLMGQAIDEIGLLRAQKADVTGTPTHFVELDQLLNGLHKSDLLILAARPSIGKTAFALNVMLNVAHIERLPVAIFSLEMGKEQLNRRLLCAHAQVSSFAVQTGRLREQEFARLREKASELKDCPLYIDDTPGLSITQLRSRARRLKVEHPNLSLIVVDYLQLMAGSEKSRRDANRQQEVSEISRGLKGLARELQVPVLALSQLSRSIEQRSKEKSAKPMLSDLRESGAIEQDADIVMFVHRERAELQRDEQGNLINKTLPVETEIIVGKHRNGPTGSARVLFWPDFTRFTNLAPS